jgi:mannose-6-phosphate isomerase-like protein (cupin superfamily)
MAERITKSWGWEIIFYNGEYCSKLLVYSKPIASSLHYHNKKHETFYIVDGSFEVEIEGQTRIMYPGDHVVIPPGTRHRVRARPRPWNNLESVIAESSSHDDPNDCVRLVPSET